MVLGNAGVLNGGLRQGVDAAKRDSLHGEAKFASWAKSDSAASRIDSARHESSEGYRRMQTRGAPTLTVIRLGSTQTSESHTGD